MQCYYDGVVENIVLWDVTPSTFNKHATVDTMIVMRRIKTISYKNHHYN